jgi:hypothetical protein
MQSTIQPEQKMKSKKNDNSTHRKFNQLMKTKILRNIFLSVGVLFASTQLLSAGMNDGVLNFSNTPLVRPQATITTFDPPGSTFTAPSAITPGGVIIGSYVDASGVTHGFLRARDGSITSFDVPGSTSTTPTSVTPGGVIIGWYGDASGVTHGFLRTPSGSFTTIDPPGSTFTYATGITPGGVIIGWYNDASGVTHGFLRARDGSITSFDYHRAVLYFPFIFLVVHLPASTRPGPSREPILTQASWSTVSCGLPTAPSRPSISRARFSPRPSPSTQQE